MNWFVFANGIGYLVASGFSAWQQRWSWSVVWFCYGLSALFLAYLEGQGK